MAEETEGPEGAVKRTRVVAVRLSEAEHAVWAAAAAEAGSGRLGAWVRATVAGVLSGVRSAPARPGPPPEVAALRAELARVGNNLNQAVRAANVAGLDRASAAELVARVDAAEAVMGRIREALRS
ncbi:plasmid mobilization protein [Kocuria marina]|uniref:plasmid mobilization protein n=1 Tax=Kocuria marina TaxID=223184 RepID=UPI0022E4038E|nr:plasmid mobilization relaxosome protein MobC [Kocuria marina]